MSDTNAQINYRGGVEVKDYNSVLTGGGNTGTMKLHSVLNTGT